MCPNIQNLHPTISAWMPPTMINYLWLLKRFNKHLIKRSFTSHDARICSKLIPSIWNSLNVVDRRDQCSTDYDNYSQQRTDAYQQQMQQAKLKSLRQSWRSSIAVTNKMSKLFTHMHDSTHDDAKDESSLLTRKRWRLLCPRHAFTEFDKEDSIELFFSLIRPSTPRENISLNLDESR